MLQKGRKEDGPTTQSDTTEDISNGTQCDVFISLKNSTYKFILFDQFKAIEDGRATGKPSEVASEVFETFKKRNGRFFMWNVKLSQYEEVDENTAAKSEWLAFLPQ